LVGATLAGTIRANGAELRDRTAIRMGETSITFGDLDDRTNRLAVALAAEGVDRDDRVAILDKNGVEFFELLFAAAKLGAVTVAVNWRLAPAEVAYIVNDAEAKVLAVGPEFVPVVDAIRAELTTVKRIVVCGDEFSVWRDEHEARDPGVTTGDDDVVTQMYTSGTTGLPKGVMLTNRNLFFAFEQMAETFGINGDAVVQVVMPLFHIAGSGWALLALAPGAQIVVHRELDPAAVVKSLERDRITHGLFVPAVLQILLGVPELETTDLSALQLIVYGASPISAEVLSRSIAAFGCGFCQAYGLTETSGGVVLLMPEDHDPGGPREGLLRSAGRPMTGAEIRIVDGDGNDAAPGTVGEILIRSPQVMKGYWHQPDATADVIDGDGWFRSGDAGYVDDDGYLYIHDRVKDMVVTGGENVYPAEVENVLMAHPDVADAAVIGVPDERWGEAVKALVVRAPGATVAANDIIGFCRERLAHYKCPTSVDWIDVLPRNPSGKILKKDLREPYWAGQTRRVH
jgi:long-chain acyl-CoA synthetase